MGAMYEVTLGPAAIRAILGLWAGGRNGLAAALRTELMNGPNADKELELKFGSDSNAWAYLDPGVPEGVIYTATPLSFNGYTALHRPMTGEELQRLQSEQRRPVATYGFYVLDILPAESAFSRPRLA